MRFKDIPGHDNIKQRLRDMAADGKLPHAILLEGPSGTGKLALAHAFATYLHCQNPTADGDSCGECPACVQHRSLNHIDTLFAFPVIKKNPAPRTNISDDFRTEWREFLDEGIWADQTRWAEILNKGKTSTQPVIYVDESANLISRLAYTTHDSRWKVVIMWLPERLNEAAANKLLKIIEEPFPDTIFLLVSDDAAHILPTIYSRTQRLKVARYADEEIAAILRDKYAVDPDDAIAIGHIAQGSMISALQQLSDNSMRTRYFEWFKELMRFAYQRDVKRLREWSNTLAAESRDRQMKFYEFAIRMMRENFMYNFGEPQLVYLNRDEEAFSTRFARFISENNVESLMDVFQQAMTDIAGNANAKIVNLDVAINVILLIKNA